MANITGKGLLGMGMLWVWLAGCHSKTALPPEAQQPVPIILERFDQDFFALDTLHLEAGLQQLQAKYPHFTDGYLQAILGINLRDPLAPEAIKAFLKSYYPVFETGNEIVQAYGSQWQSQLEKSLQWMRYLIPEFVPDTPFLLTTFVGPMDAFEPFSTGDYGDVRTARGAGVALQLHLGQEAAVYNQGLQNGIFYRYQVRRFEPGTVVVNTLKNLIDDRYPYTAAGKPLVEEMVEKGKRLYVLKQIMPEAHDSLLLGYTGDQLKGCLENEALIWQFFVKNDLLFSIDPGINQGYIKDGPKTPELGDGSPGYIGLFTGLRMVEAFMAKKPETTLTQLMAIPPDVLWNASGYKPR